MEAVRYIHSKGIIHGDIATRNFLVTDKNSLVLADFGGSSIDGSPCSVLPSIRYMAPSYIENVASGPTKKHDLFSLGTIFWEISTDEPFHFGRGNYMVKTIFLQRNFPTLGPQQDIYNLRVIVDKCWKELYNDAEEASRELHYEMIVR
jgi:serine/threonine protein kinase